MSYYPKAQRFTKKNAQEYHAIRRAKERYGIQLSIDDVKIISKMIQEGRTRFVEKLSRARTKHIVDYKNRYLLVVYDKSRRTLITVLPDE